MMLDTASNPPCVVARRRVRRGLVLAWVVTAIGLGSVGRLIIPDASALPAQPLIGQRMRVTVIDVADAGGAVPVPSDTSRDRQALPVIPAPGVAESPVTGWNRRLTGVVISGSDLREALFDTAGQTQAFTEGQQIDGWTLTTIRPDGVALKGPNGKMTLTLEGKVPDDQNAAQSAQADQNAAVDRAVSAALLDQQTQQAAAESALIDATHQMTASGSP